METPTLRGRTVVVGVSGGIAAYKACELVRWLKQRGAAVVVVMTPAATEFVTPLTFQTLSGNPVIHGLWGDQQPALKLPNRSASRVRGRVEHVDIAEAADCLVIAPATADLLARLVHGEAPDALTAVTLACAAPLILCPAMDLEMWRKPAVQTNLRALRERGAMVVGPETGELASGLSGPGRLAAIESIGEAIELAVARRTELEGVRVLIGTGRTEEPIDPVRVLTNRSSGRMGFALAEASRDRGAQVTVVSGPTSIEPPGGVSVVPVTTAAEMLRAMTRAAPRNDVVLMAAAVADFRPARATKSKLKRGSAPNRLEHEPKPDILASLAERRRRGQVIVGFALETSNGLRNAREKLKRKKLDLVALNHPRESLGGESTRLTLVEARRTEPLPAMSKRRAAEAILDRVVALRGKARHKPARSKKRSGT